MVLPEGPTDRSRAGHHDGVVVVATAYPDAVTALRALTVDTAWVAGDEDRRRGPAASRRLSAARSAAPSPARAAA